MASQVCSLNAGGSLQVHKTDVVEQLVIDSADNIHTMYMPREEISSRRKQRPLTTSSVLNKMDQQTLTGSSPRLQGWLSDKTIKTVQDKADTDAKNTRKMYESVLDTEDTFVKDIEAFLEHKEMLDLRKKEILHKRWNDRVYEPIRQQVVNAGNSKEYTELDRRKRELYKEYLEHVNKKGHVFLDTFSPEEYYPLSLHPVRPSLLKAETERLQDPLLSQGRQRSSEDRLAFRCLTGSKLTDSDVEQIRLPPLPLVPLGRHGTECSTWLEMPMGDIESPVRFASRRRMCPTYNASQFAFTEWQNPSRDQDVVAREMNIQKRKRCPPEMSYIAYKPVAQKSKQTVSVQVEG